MPLFGCRSSPQRDAIRLAALQWVQANVSRFGGGPCNVTIFGESGGGAKVTTLCAMPTAKGLFHKAIVESGSNLEVNTPEQAYTAWRLRLSRIDELAVRAASLQGEL